MAASLRAETRPNRQRALLVVNPASRSGARFQQAAMSAFRSAGVYCDVVRTERAGQGADMAESLAPKYDAVFTLGGDGTAMEVVGALAGTGRPVGILPGGTGNLLARTLGIPLNIRRAVQVLVGGAETDVDLGHLSQVTIPGDRHFAFAAGVGTDAAMIAETPKGLKQRIGVLAYALSWMRVVLRRDAFQARLVVDGEVIERQATAVMIANFGAVLSNLIQLGPGITEDDGKLDLCVFSGGTFRDALRVAYKLWRKDFRTDPCMLYRAGRHFRVETDPPRLAQADGELLGVTPFEVTVAPRAARLLVPASYVLSPRSDGLNPDRR